MTKDKEQPGNGKKAGSADHAELANLAYLLEQNLKLTQEIKEMAEKTGRYIFWGRVATIAKYAIILIPLILALIYLPPFIRDRLDPLADVQNDPGPFQQCYQAFRNAW